MDDNNINRFSQQDAANANSMAQAARSLTEELKDQLGIRSRLNETQKETLSLARELQMSAQQNTVEIGNSGNIEKQIAKDVKINLNLRRELLDTQKGITEDIKLELERLREADKLGEEAYIRAFQSASQETQKIALLQKSIDLSNTLLQQRKEEAIIQQKINDKMGVTGALVKGVGGLMERLGMRSGIFQDAMKNSAEVMREMAEETVRGTANFSKLQIMAKGFSELAKGFGKALFDPLTILTSILDTYLEINKASVEVQRLTGQNAVTAASWNTGLATAKDYLETVSELTKETGMNAQNVFSKDVLAGAAELKTLMGLTAQEAGGLAIMSQTSGKSIQDITDSVVATTSAFNKTNRSAVSQGQILRDVANTSQSIKLSLGNNDVAITKAAAAAGKLGLNLERVDQIASSLLNFEDSIGKELEAELLLGKELNLEKARELALNNDLAGLSEELFKNSADINEFGKLNRIQQEAYAASLGMSRDELAKIAYTQALAKGMTEEQAAAAAKVNAEDMKRVTAQENFANALAKIAGALAPILDVVGSILNLPLAPYFVIAAIATAKLGFSISGIGKGFGSMYNMGKKALLGIAEFAKAPLQGLKAIGSKLAGGFKQGATGMGASSPWSPASQAADKTSKSGTGEGFKKKMQNIAEGIKAFGNAKVLFGAINLIPSSIGLIAMIPGVLGAKAIEQINGEKFQESMLGLATGIEAMGKGKVFLGSLGLIAASVGLIAMIPGVLGGLALAAAATPISVGLNVLGTALASFGALMAAGGLLGVAALAGAAIALGIALNLAAPGIEAFGTVITAVFSGLATLIPVIVDGFVTLISTIVTGIGPMLLLGPALFGIAAGLGAVAMAGLVAIPAIGGLVMLAAVAPALVSLGIGGKEKTAGEAKGKAEEGTMAGVEEKLTQLIQVIKQGGHVYMDTNKVGKALKLGNFSIQ